MSRHQVCHAGVGRRPAGGADLHPTAEIITEKWPERPRSRYMTKITSVSDERIPATSPCPPALGARVSNRLGGSKCAAGRGRF